MIDVEDSTLREWIERLWRLPFVGHAERDVVALLEEALSVAGRGGGLAMLLKRNTVVLEEHRSAGPETFEAPERLRKAAARLAISAQDHRRPDPVLERDHVLAPVPIDEKRGAAVALVEPTPDAVRFLVAGARLLAEALDAAHARRIAEHAEEALHRGGVGAVAYLKRLSELERDAIELALRESGWNKEEAARRLGISRASIYMKVKKYGLQHPPREEG